MKKLAELQTAEFVDLLASDAPAPGGGSAAALEGALGAALTAMVLSLIHISTCLVMTSKRPTPMPFPWLASVTLVRTSF